MTWIMTLKYLRWVILANWVGVAISAVYDYSYTCEATSYCVLQSPRYLQKTDVALCNSVTWCAYVHSNADS